MCAPKLSSLGYNTEGTFYSLSIVSEGARCPHAGHCIYWCWIYQWGCGTAAMPLQHCCESGRRASESANAALFSYSYSKECSIVTNSWEFKYD